MKRNDFIGLYNREMSDSISRRQNAIKAELKKSEARCAEIDGIIKRLYEDNLCGKISDERFTMLAKDYETEQVKLKEKIVGLNTGLKEIKEQDDGLNKFLSIVDRYTEIPELTAEILNAFVDRIYMGERVRGGLLL